MTTRTLPSSDFYGLERTLEPSELAVLHAVRTVLRTEVESIATFHGVTGDEPRRRRLPQPGPPSHRCPTPSPRCCPMADTAHGRYRARMMTRPSWPRRRRGLAATLVVIGVAGCGDDPSAEERVCDARTELREAVDEVVADIEAGNFGDASDGTAAIGDAYDELASAVDELGQEQREVLAPDVENLRADIEALPEAQGLDQLGSSIEAILTGVQHIYDEVTDALRCE